VPRMLQRSPGAHCSHGAADCRGRRSMIPWNWRTPWRSRWPSEPFGRARGWCCCRRTSLCWPLVCVLACACAPVCARVWVLRWPQFDPLTRCTCRRLPLLIDNCPVQSQRYLAAVLRFRARQFQWVHVICFFPALFPVSMTVARGWENTLTPSWNRRLPILVTVTLGAKFIFLKTGPVQVPLNKQKISKPLKHRKKYVKSNGCKVEKPNYLFFQALKFITVDFTSLWPTNSKM